ncbi:lysophospholipid acyltransferase family protein [Asticcacaulis sp. AC402]|uniref:lysophospholipid acyltransferase family protein n=1 Tax=Asticcacaulis sp. AC402 TaxID=1282361 RepID=UPI0003C40067|nr:lysophospholipid acyltransferase family protein [Asticcacaulis sp. AC402]ESQ73805.1 hypothetical protein ABAC402_17315 [Asticcacaulis sp. AC402]
MIDKKQVTQKLWLRSLIADVLIAYLRFCYATTKWQVEGDTEIKQVWASKQPVVLMFWHERLHLGHASWPTVDAQPVAVLSSQSKFGDVIAKVNTAFGRHSIRGSKAKKSDPSKNKGGAQAFRDLLRWLKSGNCAATTPDGPRGPRRVMTEGSLKMSQVTGAVMVCLGQSTRNQIRLDTWDRMRIPLPFSRGAMVWKVLPAIPADIDADAFERLRLDIESELSAVTDRADSLVGASA